MAKSNSGPMKGKVGKKRRGRYAAIPLKGGKSAQYDAKLGEKMFGDIQARSRADAIADTQTRATTGKARPPTTIGKPPPPSTPPTVTDGRPVVTDPLAGAVRPAFKGSPGNTGIASLASQGKPKPAFRGSKKRKRRQQGW